MSEGLKCARAATWGSRNLGDGHPSASGISALLKDAGFPRADRNRMASTGFEVGRFGTLGGVVTVRYRFTVMDEVDAGPDVMLAEYASVIEAAGYKVHRDDRVDRLIVTGEESAP